MSNDVTATLEPELGPTGELGVSACLYDPTGDAISRIEYKARQFFPLASVVKVAIAMKYETDVFYGNLSPQEAVPIFRGTSSPGPATNPLDRLFFIPWTVEKSATLEQLHEMMLTSSDNTAADVLLQRVGGTDAIMAFLPAEVFNPNAVYSNN